MESATRSISKHVIYTPGRLQDILAALEVYYKGKISLGRVREDIGLSSNELLDLLDNLGLSPIYSKEEMRKGLERIEELKRVKYPVS